VTEKPNVPQKPTQLREVSQNSALEVMKFLTLEKLKGVDYFPPPSVSAIATYQLTFLHAPLFVSGNYTKYSRAVSQSQWIINGSKKTETSVEEVIFDGFKDYAKFQDIKFNSAGREDSDVRMLGTGRPFILQLNNPLKFNLDAHLIEKIQAQINTSKLVNVSNLRILMKEETGFIKEGEEKKRKSYRCLVWSSRKVTEMELHSINQMSNFQIEQKTPIRVMHRRSIAIRKKVIHKIFCTRVNSHFLSVDLETEAGTYIKEFVHSDLGRTSPSLAKLLQTEANIIQLDCLAIHM